ncbi:flagellar protein FliS [Litorivivens lipolytica]|uniref:Flagellar secretion chaperone FliS n=1 Tax=Litorivivens lipolytica TaxID=1524264 RepID=A0A7W4W2R0_9GAMM|nr:flagellar export chaperone FliS [Litorivivens lipolytica]MBB3046372.1 flagellar protein FliS [Litorivivens lipolytica]
MSYSNGRAVNAYNTVGVNSRIESASPHRLISLLLDGALEKIAVAKGHIQRNEVTAKAQSIGRAMSIVEGLRMSLDHSVKNEITTNLDELYSYMGRRLLYANLKSDAAVLDEVSDLLRELHEAWTAIGDQETKPAIAAVE